MNYVGDQRQETEVPLYSMLAIVILILVIHILCLVSPSFFLFFFKHLGTYKRTTSYGVKTSKIKDMDHKSKRRKTELKDTLQCLYMLE